MSFVNIYSMLFVGVLLSTLSRYTLSRFSLKKLHNFVFNQLHYMHLRSIYYMTNIELVLCMYSLMPYVLFELFIAMALVTSFMISSSFLPIHSTFKCLIQLPFSSIQVSLREFFPSFTIYNTS